MNMILINPSVVLMYLQGNHYNFNVVSLRHSVHYNIVFSLLSGPSLWFAIFLFMLATLVYELVTKTDAQK